MVQEVDPSFPPALKACGAGRQAETLRPALRRFFARKGASPADLDDLVQDVFLRIVKRGNTDSLDSFEAYLFATAASVFTDRHRRQTVRMADQHVPFEPELHGDYAIGPDRIAADRQALRATTKVLLALPERTRRVFVLRRIEGMAYAEIAQRLGLSVSAAEKHMLRAARYLLKHAGDWR